MNNGSAEVTYKRKAAPHTRRECSERFQGPLPLVFTIATKKLRGKAMSNQSIADQIIEFEIRKAELKRRLDEAGIKSQNHELDQVDGLIYFALQQANATLTRLYGVATECFKQGKESTGETQNDDM